MNSMNDYYIAINIFTKLHGQEVALNTLPYIYHISSSDEKYTSLCNKIKSNEVADEILNYYINTAKSELSDLIRKQIGNYKKTHLNILQVDIAKMILQSSISLICYSHSEIDDITYMSSKEHIKMIDDTINNVFEKQEILSIAKDTLETLYKRKFNKRPMVVYMNFNDSYNYIYNELRRGLLKEYTLNEYNRNILSELLNTFNPQIAQYIYEIIIAEVEINKNKFYNNANNR